MKSIQKQRRDKDFFKLIPLVQLGEFEFGSSIYSYQHYDFQFLAEDDITEWSTYYLDDEGLRIYVEEGLIQTIKCLKSCIIGGFEIIGMKFDEFLEHWKIKEKSLEKDLIYDASYDASLDVYEVDSLGLQLWVFNGRIEFIYCSDE